MENTEILMEDVGSVSSKTRWVVFLEQEAKNTKQAHIQMIFLTEKAGIMVSP
jgi:hypothetical protein